jgi:hypothetical protein
MGCPLSSVNLAGRIRHFALVLLDEKVFPARSSDALQIVVLGANAAHGGVLWRVQTCCAIPRSIFGSSGEFGNWKGSAFY